MAHLKQSKKRILTNEKARVRNKKQRTAMKTAVKKVVSAPTKAEAQTALAAAMSQLDKAGKKNLIHKNAASRTKSRLAKRIKAMAS